MLRDEAFDWIAYAQKLEIKIRDLQVVAQQAKGYMDELIGRGEGCGLARHISQRLDEALAKAERA